eukprot:CAMPEP_0198308226 /NCGR_PEP_ID=MMETSP1450-20131203/945_1 /TAXON_ID=753684 ORGANISM="Madagascaria erythrocladiodes, Strain CCMP3234" /NCGR_SAMPLE_ID=MMETSP1450 /ASSEMBLY_ACC=CAM_ASM_001115 /LENGTH=40 /DNA_ID= /DNA_START= /DNA_END= /DNA_ORIENTATION=
MRKQFGHHIQAALLSGHEQRRSASVHRKVDVGTMRKQLGH